MSGAPQEPTDRQETFFETSFKISGVFLEETEQEEKVLITPYNVQKGVVFFENRRFLFEEEKGFCTPFDHEKEEKELDQISVLLKRYQTETFPEGLSGVFEAEEETRFVVVNEKTKESGQWKAVLCFDFCYNKQNKSVEGMAFVKTLLHEDGCTKIVYCGKLDKSIVADELDVVETIKKYGNAFVDEFRFFCRNSVEGGLQNTRKKLPINKQTVNWDFFL